MNMKQGSHNWILSIALTTLFLVSLACGASIPKTEPASENNQEQVGSTEPAKPTITSKPISTLPPTNTSQPETPNSPKYDGFYTVGMEIAPGTWESTGDGDSCYWQRLDDKQETIANHFGLAGGTITILKSDYEVQLKDCGTWIYVEGLQQNTEANTTEPKEDGFYTVGVEIAPGKWESTGDSASCYWQRLDNNQETIANHFGLAGGTITILESDYEVQLKDCGAWNYVEGLERNIEDSATEPKEDGFYTVGVEIAPGKWESTGDGDSCYWQRLDDKQETIDNHFGLAGGTMTILESDYEVQLKDCGTWSYLGK